MKTLYGGLAEAICEELFSYGRLTCSETIRKVATRMEQPLADVGVHFQLLCSVFRFYLVVARKTLRYSLI